MSMVKAGFLTLCAAFFYINAGQSLFLKLCLGSIECDLKCLCINPTGFTVMNWLPEPFL